MLLAGDIGGTKTNLAIFSPTVGAHEPVTEATFASGRYGDLEALVRDFLDDVNLPVEQAVFAVAGPVVRGTSRITNLPWVIETARLQRVLHLRRVSLINDLVAVAWAVPVLQPEDVVVLNEGVAEPHGALAVIAPGTGLGEAFLVWDGQRYLAHPSEGGHTDFGPTNDVEAQMLRYLQARYDHVSYERLCSGIGLPNIYAFLRDSGRAPEPEWLARQLAETNDPTPIIVNNALDPDAGSRLCVDTLDLFISVLGAEAANLALKVLATGGVYIGGGIPPRIRSRLEQGRFLQAFLRKGRFAELLSRMPLRLVLNAKAGLIGAAHYGLQAAGNALSPSSPGR